MTKQKRATAEHGRARRSVLRTLGLAAAGTALATTAGNGAAVAREAGRRPGGDGPRTYLLVHGTHSAGVHLAGVAGELQRRGHRAVTVDLPWHGNEAFVPEAYQRQDLDALATEPSPLAGLTLDDYAHRVERHVRTAARYGPVVLVGHSMGGTSVNRVADAVPQLLDHICYFAAFCPSRAMPTLEACMSSPEGAGAISPDDQVIGDPEQLGVVRLNWRTGRPRDLAVFKEMICAGYPDTAFRRVLNAMQTDECVRAYGGRAVGGAGTWGRIPRTYLRMGRDRLVTPELQDRMIAEADEATPGNRFRVRDFPSAPHMGPLDPREVADALHEVRLRRG
jgi:pimeloyl-ACP methyl ester carboxylesterase